MAVEDNFGSGVLPCERQGVFITRTKPILGDTGLMQRMMGRVRIAQEVSGYWQYPDLSRSPSEWRRTQRALGGERWWTCRSGVQSVSAIPRTGGAMRERGKFKRRPGSREQMGVCITAIPAAAGRCRSVPLLAEERLGS